MKILIIGGTKFLGRSLVEAAVVSNHEITLFNRGLTNPDLFPEIEYLTGDRHQELNVLKNRQWDAAIDTCGFTPNSVGRIVDLLAGSVNHYTFISSQSVYADFAEPQKNENAPVQTTNENLNDETVAETYGARKAAAEQAAEKSLPNRVLSVRAGLIVGAHDYIDRFPYWVKRVSHGGEVLAPASPDRPLQLIDVRDLAEWIIRMIENGETGIYNATGFDYQLTFGEFLETCRAVSQSDAIFTWINEEFLLANNVKPWSEMPMWLPGAEGVNFFSLDCRKAFQAGLEFRPLGETVKETLDWIKTRGHPKPEPERPLVTAQGQIGMTAEREKELLRLWHERR